MQRSTSTPALFFFAGWLGLSAGCYLFLGYDLDRSNFPALLTAYGGAFLLYFAATAFLGRRLHWGWILASALLLRILFLTSTPTLSDDFHRFLWDGALTAHGENPYQETPETSAQTNGPNPPGEHFREMNSRQFFSVYPPLLQAIFAGASASSSLHPKTDLIFLRLVLLAAETATLVLLPALLRRRKTADNIPFALYAWNPLILVELTGNLHFEGLMIFSLALFLYLSEKSRPLGASFALSLGVAAKLLPLLILPLLWRRWGFRTFLQGATIVAGVNAALWAPFWFPELPVNYLSSLRLYFDHFEFNAGILRIARPFFSLTGLDKIPGISPALFLSLLSTVLICAYSVRRKTAVNRSLPFSLLIIWSLYLLPSTTIHPWYITPLIFFSVLTNHRFPVLWSFLIPLTYITYARQPYAGSTVVLVIEYTAVFLFLLWESNLWQRPWKALKLRIAEQKLRLFRDLLQPGQSILEIGAGNGALARCLQRHGMRVDAIDLANRSRFPSVAVETFDGHTLPRPDHSVATAQLITVLHHARNPRQLLSEAARVSDRILVMEDVYRNAWRKHLVHAADSLVNAEFKGHPHNNRTEAEWRILFDDLDLEIELSRRRRVLGIFEQVLFSLRPKHRDSFPSL